MSRIAVSHHHPSLQASVRGEFLELPGLRLTIAQAGRLWNVDPLHGRDVLDALVEAAFLRRSGPYYVRADADDAGVWAPA
jgi:hypothetical protein